MIEAEEAQMGHMDSYLPRHADRTSKHKYLYTKINLGLTVESKLSVCLFLLIEARYVCSCFNRSSVCSLGVHLFVANSLITAPASHQAARSADRRARMMAGGWVGLSAAQKAWTKAVWRVVPMALSRVATKWIRSNAHSFFFYISV